MFRAFYSGELLFSAQQRLLLYLIGTVVFSTISYSTSLLFDHYLISLALQIIALSFCILSIIIVGKTLKSRFLKKRMMRQIKNMSDYDHAQIVATDLDGKIIYQNRSALDKFGNKKDELYSDSLDGLFAAPVRRMHLLRREAKINGFATETIEFANETLTLSVHLIEDKCYLWRINHFNLKAAARNDNQLDSNAPVILVSKTGVILDKSPAAVELLGRDVSSIRSLFDSEPAGSGSVLSVNTRHGSTTCTYCVSERSNEIREVYLFPTETGPQDFDSRHTFIDSLPVSFLKLNLDGVITMANQGARELLCDPHAKGSLLADQVEGLGRPISEWLREACAGHHLGTVEVVRAIKPKEDMFLQISLGPCPLDRDSALVAVLQDATELKALEAQYIQSQKMEAIGQLAGGVAHDFNNLLTAILGHCDLLLLGRTDHNPEYSDLSQIHLNANRAAALVRQLLAFSRKQTLSPEQLVLTESLSDLIHLLNRLVGEKIELELDHDPNLNIIRADRRQLDQVLMNLVVNARDAMPKGGKVKIETRNTIVEKELVRDRARVQPGEYVTIRVIDQGIGIESDKIGKIFQPFYTTKEPGQGTGLGLSMAYGIVKQMGGYIFVDSTPNKGTTFSLLFPVCHENAPYLESAKHQYVSCEGKLVEERLDEAQLGEPVQIIPFWADIEHSPVEHLDKSITDTDAKIHNISNKVSENDAHELAKPIKNQKAKMNANFATASDIDIVSKNEGVILLVEDEAPVRAFAARALRLRGYRVIVADSAEDALKTLEDEDLNIDVFVTDVVMPGMDGPTWVAKALKKRPNVRVVFVSGYAEDSVTEHQSRIPNSIFLPKPFSLTDLTSTVQRQISL